MIRNYVWQGIVIYMHVIPWTAVLLLSQATPSILVSELVTVTCPTNFDFVVFWSHFVWLFPFLRSEFGVVFNCVLSLTHRGGAQSRQIAVEPFKLGSSCNYSESRFDQSQDLTLVWPVSFQVTSLWYELGSFLSEISIVIGPCAGLIRTSKSKISVDWKLECSSLWFLCVWCVDAICM